jgi:hypothetical protein
MLSHDDALDLRQTNQKMMHTQLKKTADLTAAAMAAAGQARVAVTPALPRDQRTDASRSVHQEQGLHDYVNSVQKRNAPAPVSAAVAAPPDLASVLAANGLGQFTDVLLAEQITLEDAPGLTADELKDLGIPLGPRKRLVNLFADLSLL